MKRTTISLSDGIAAALARESQRRNRSASDIAREALAKHLGLDPRQPRELPFAKLGDSGHRTTGRDMESLLEREWHDDTRSR